jgi:hypothetical protein
VYELVDRYSIALLKDEKFTEGNREEVEFYEQQLKQDYDIELVKHKIQDLIKVHREIWSMEDDFKKGRIDNEPLEIIGRRALEVRDLNAVRVKLKNNLALTLGDTLIEKKSYAGEKSFSVPDFHNTYYYHTKPWKDRYIRYIDFSNDSDIDGSPNFEYQYINFLNNKKNYSPNDILVLENPYIDSHLQRPLVEYLNHFARTSPNPFVFLTSRWNTEKDGVRFPVYNDLFQEHATHFWTFDNAHFEELVRPNRHHKVIYTSTKDYPWRRHVYKMLQETCRYPGDAVLYYSCLATNFDYSWKRGGDRGAEVFDYYTDDFLDNVANLPGIPTETVGNRIDFDALPHELLNDSFLNVIVDTQYRGLEPRPFFSEKVFNAIAHRQLFIYTAAPNSLRILKEKGYHIFEELFDLNYDSIGDPQERILAFTKSVQNFVKRPLHDISQDYIRVMDKIEENFQRLKSASFESKMDQAIGLALKGKQ